MKATFQILFLFLIGIYSSIWKFVSAQDQYPIETLMQKGHIQPVRCISAHPSGLYFASGSGDHSIKIWDTKTNRIIRSINNHTGSVNSIEFSKDGNFILSSSMDKYCIITDIRTGKKVKSFKVEKKFSYIMEAHYSVDESHILIGTNADHFIQINIDSGERVESERGYSASFDQNAVSPSDNSRLHYLDYKGVTLIHQMDSIDLPFDKANNHQFSPDGKLVVIGSDKLFAEIVEVATGKVLHKLVANDENKCDGCKTKVFFSPDNNTVATSDKYNGIVLWNAKSGKKLFSVNDSKDGFDRLEFSKDGNKILASNDDEFGVLDLKKKKINFLGTSEYIDWATPKFNSDASAIFIASALGAIDEVGINNGKKIKSYKGYLNKTKNDNLRYSYSRWTDQGILNLIKNKNTFDISNDGTYLAQGKIDTTVVITNLETGKIFKVLKGHNHKVISVIFHPTKNEIISGDSNGNLIIWDAVTGSIKFEKRIHTNVIFDIAFNSNGTEFLTSSWDGAIRHFNYSNFSQIGQIYKEQSSSYNVTFSPNDLYIIAGDLDENTTYYYETDTKLEAKTIIGHSNRVSDILIKNDRLFTSSWDGSLKIWDFKTATLTDKVYSINKAAVLSIAVHPTLPLLYFGSSDRNIYCYDLDKKEIIQTIVNSHLSGVTDLQIFPTKNQLFSRSVEGEIKIWDITSLQEEMTLLQMNQSDWLISKPNGFFDGTDNAMKQINYTSGLKSLPLESFFKKYYYPDLYQQVQNGNRFIEKDQGINSIMNELPHFDLKWIQDKKTPTAFVTDSIYEVATGTLDLEMAIDSRQKNIDKISVFNNRKLILEETFQSEIAFRGSNSSRSVSIPLNPMINEVEVFLTTTSGLKTTGQKININYDTIQGKTDLFVLSIGINQYENPAYNLKYAKNDCKEFAATIAASGDQLFSETYITTISNKEANRENVIKSIQEMKSKMGPEDVFIFYFAGHGILYSDNKMVNSTSEFFLIMNDVTNLYGDLKMLESKGLSAKDLLEISKTMPAQKQIFVLDACQSGAALNSLAVRGVEREKTMAQLAKNTGTFFITASQDFEFANEVGNLKHGIFTYSIIEMLTGNSDEFPSNETVTVYELKSYVEARVPELSKIHHGSPQYPTGYSFGNDFPIGIVK